MIFAILKYLFIAFFPTNGNSTKILYSLGKIAVITILSSCRFDSLVLFTIDDYYFTHDYQYNVEASQSR